MPADHDATVSPVPRWFEGITIAAAAALAGTGIVGLALALFGRYSTWIAVSCGLAAAAGAAYAAGRGPRPARSSAQRRAALAAAAIVLAFAVFAGSTPSQHVVLARDPGSYQSTARLLSRTGTLEFDGRGSTFEGVEGLRFASAAVFDTGAPFPAEPDPANPGALRQSGQLETQFNHLTAVVLAASYDIGGPWLMFRLPAMAAGLMLAGVYIVAARLCRRRPSWALIAPASLAVSSPLLFVARNTYSEAFAAALLWASVLVAATLHDRPRISNGVLAGALFGAVAATRVDALVYLVLAVPLAGLSVAHARGPALRSRLAAWTAVAISAAATGAVGWYDLVERTGGYSNALEAELTLLRNALGLGFLVSVLGVLLWRYWPALRHAGARLASPTSWVAAAVVVGLFLTGWLIRPHIQEAATAKAPFPVVSALQEREGLAIEPARTYDELSLRWMGWYLGVPMVAAAVVVAGIAVWRIVRGRADATLVAVTTLCCGGGGLYWWKPNIAPDHLWAMRRFIPAAMPSLAILAAFGAALAADHLAKRNAGGSTRWVHGLLGLAVAGMLLAPAALTTWPVRDQTQQANYLGPVLDLCDALPPDAAIVIVQAYAELTLPQTLRGWCGVPVAGQGSAFGPDPSAVAAEIAGNGRRLFLLSLDRSVLDRYRLPGGPAPWSSRTATPGPTAEITLTRAPSQYGRGVAETPVGDSFTLWTIEVPT